MGWFPDSDVSGCNKNLISFHDFQIFLALQVIGKSLDVWEKCKNTTNEEANKIRIGKACFLLCSSASLTTLPLETKD